MKPTLQLHEAGQSLWLDNITRGLLDRGTLAHYIAEDAVTGLTSNPTSFDKAIEGGSDYDTEIATHKAAGESDEELLGRPVPGCGGRLSAGRRTAGGGWPGPGRQLGGFGVREPVGHGGGRPGPRRAS